MLAPTPVLKPSPMDISGIFAGTFEALKRRFGLFVVLTLFPAALGAVLMIVGVAILITSAVAAGAGSRASLPVGIVIGAVCYLLGIIAAGLGQLKGHGMMALAAYEIAQGQRPDFRGLLTRTRGFLPRMAPVIALGVVAGLLFAGLFFGLFAGSFASLDSSGDSRATSGAILGVFGAMALMMLILLPLSYYFAVKLLYTVPATAIEAVGGIDGMKRSWRLTNGAFWRTLGYYLVAAIAVSIASSTISGIGQVGMVPMFASMGSSTNSRDPGAVLAAMAGLIPVFVIMGLLILALEAVAVPFMQTYITYMYIDQVRRSEMPAGGSGYSPTGGFYAQPNQYYGQPGQYYGQPGQPGQPNQPYGPTGTGYPHPAQYPQQGGWQAPLRPGEPNPNSGWQSAQSGSGAAQDGWTPPQGGMQPPTESDQRAPQDPA